MEEQQQPLTPMTYSVRFWFSGLEHAIEFQILKSDFDRFQSYLAETVPNEFFEFDTPGHTVVLANMVEVDAVKLMATPGVDDFVREEEPSEATIHLVGRDGAFFASTSEEHLGPDHPVRQLLDVETETFIYWLDARGNTVVMNPKRLSYVEHPKYWIEAQEDWSDNDSDETDDEVEAAVEEPVEEEPEGEDEDENEDEDE
jgi:hypothetical protein